MTKINNTKELQDKIIELELCSKEQGFILKQELRKIIDDAHPVELLKHGIKELVTSSEVQNELLGLSMSLSSGYIAKKLIVGNSTNIFQQIMGNILSLVVSRNVAINSEKISSGVFFFLENLMANKKWNKSPNHKSNE